MDQNNADLKPELGVSNKYYLVWDPKGDSNVVLQFVADKARELVKDFKHGEVSVIGICLKLPTGVITKLPNNEGMFLINKKRFKKHIKKAFHQAKQ